MKDPLPREAQILRDRRESLHISQEDIAYEVGLQLRQYQRFEYGDRSFSKCNVRLALKICAVLELDPYEVIFENGLDLAR